MFGGMSATPNSPHDEGQGIDPRAAHPSNHQPATQVFGRCDRHWFDPSLAVCDDCEARMCVSCVVAVHQEGTLCAECALTRAGVKARRNRGRDNRSEGRKAS